MRTALTATAFTALALFTAAPSALAGTEASPSPTGHTKQAERLMRVADRFDGNASAMRTRAGRLRSTALQLRQEAERLAGTDVTDPDGMLPGEDAGEFDVTGREGGESTDVPTGDDPTPGTDPGAGSPDGACAWDGEDDLGFSRGQSHELAIDDEETGTDERVCHLLRKADRLEQRARTLDAAAARMQQHACKLRTKAATLLGASGKGSAERMLVKAAKLREAASRLRASADALRETAFEGTDVDDATVDRIRSLELTAAANDRRADRLEARAAATVR